ncbi:hypothetical protein [Microcoleus anatoxicus]
MASALLLPNTSSSHAIYALVMSSLAMSSFDGTSLAGTVNNLLEKQVSEK